jgi:DinB superfamily
VQSLSPIVEKLAEAQTTFFRAADAIPCEQWRAKPGAAEWSAAEVAAHLVMVERAIVGGADRATQKAPKQIALLKRLHLPIWLVESRVIRRKSPLPLDPTLLGAKEEMLGELRAARERSLAFLVETEKRDLSAYRWKHAFLGMLNVYEWFEMIAAHQIRHAKQVREIGERLPKVVTSAENR